MPRAPASFDAFTAIAEPRRRRLLEVLAGRRMPVTDIMLELHWPQPMVSKHLSVLRQVGLVRVERHKRQKVYEMNADPLQAVHTWAGGFEKFWDRQLRRIKQRAEAQPRGDGKSSISGKETGNA